MSDEELIPAAYDAYSSATYGVYAMNHDEGIKAAVAAVLRMVEARLKEPTYPLDQVMREVGEVSP